MADTTFKYRRDEPMDSSVCKAASYLGTYMATATDTSARMSLMCVQSDISGKMQLYSNLEFNLPIDPQTKTKIFRFVSPAYQKFTSEDYQLAANTFSSFPKVIKGSSGRTLGFTFTCLGGPTDFKGEIEATFL